MDAEVDRKADHIRLALEDRMQVAGSAFSAWTFGHEALAEIDRAAIDLTTEFLGYRLRLPLLISCMTGGTEVAARVNQNLAIAAQATGVALGVGSQRKALEDPSQADTFRVRHLAPDVPLVANLGAVQLNYGYGLAECQAAVDMIEADALALHLNPLQEAIQPEGQCNFACLLPRIEKIAEGLTVPIIVKEVGSGLSATTGQRLLDIGVRYLDTAGVGGTSWARIEAARADDLEIGELFADWGIPTPESIRSLRSLSSDVTIVGSGGLRSGLDAAKALALGADLVGIAQPFLQAALDSADRVVERIERTRTELEVAMFCLGVTLPSRLRRTDIRRRDTT
jgi:isopentenyl-diphosphate delta-isomerase